MFQSLCFIPNVAFLSLHFSGYPPTPNTPGVNHAMTTPSEYPQPPAAALSAAALVAAATATATATATASMVALQEQQNQNMSMNMNVNMNNHYPQVRNTNVCPP